MADQSTTHTTAASTSGSSSGLAFVVGALVVVVAVLAWFMFADGSGSSDDLTINIEGAAEAVEGAAAEVSGN